MLPCQGGGVIRRDVNLPAGASVVGAASSTATSVIVVVTNILLLFVYSAIIIADVTCALYTITVKR